MKTPLEYSFKFSGNSWNIVYDKDSDSIIAEIRNGETRKVWFISICLKEKQVCWEYFPVGETWWLGLTATGQGKVFLHKYKNPQFPETQGIVVLDIYSGNLLWKSQGFTFYKLIGDTLIATDASKTSPAFVYLDPSTGTIEKEVEETDFLGTATPLVEERVLAPSVYKEGDAYFSETKAFLVTMNKKPVRIIEYLEMGKVLVLSFYEEKEPHIENVLMLLDKKSGVVIWETIIQKEVEGIGFGTFFAIKESILFVRDKKEIVILEVSS